MSNLGQLDRLLRVLIGLALVAVPLVSGWAIWTSTALLWGSVLVGIALIVTATLGFCPIYALLGLSSKRRRVM